MQMTAKTESVQCGPTEREREDITFDFFFYPTTYGFSETNVYCDNP